MPPLARSRPRRRRRSPSRLPVPERAEPAPLEKAGPRETALARSRAKAAPGPVPRCWPIDQAEQKALNLDIKKVADALKLEEAELDLAIAKAKGTRRKSSASTSKRSRAARKAAEDEQAIREKYAKGAEDRGNKEPSPTNTGRAAASSRSKTSNSKSRRSRRLQRHQERQAEQQIRDLEAARKIKDQAEATDFRSVERQEKLGQITVAAAAAAELQIVDAHRAAVDQILAEEERAAAGQEKLEHEVAARKVEVAQQTADKITDINEKAADEEIKRAHATDQSIASGLAGALTGGKESLGQAVQKIFQEQEKKLVEKGITQVLDASGIGKALNSGEDSLLGFLPGAPKDKASAGADKLGAATDKNTAATDKNTAALEKGQPGAAGGAAGAPATGAAPTGATGAAIGAAPTGPAPAAPPQYAAAIGAAAAQWNVPPAILTNLLGAESGFNPNAVGPPVASRGGEKAKGLGQFMPEEAQRYGVDVFNPESSISGAAHYASDLRREKGSWAGALGAYSGQGPSLSGYAAEKNPYGPALVEAAKTADRSPLLSPGAGSAVAAGAPSAAPAPEAAATGNAQPAAAAAPGEAAASGIPVDVQAVAGSTVSVADGLPIAAPETAPDTGILASLGEAIIPSAHAETGGAAPAPETAPAAPGLFGQIGQELSAYWQDPIGHLKETLGKDATDLGTVFSGAPKTLEADRSATWGELPPFDQTPPAPEHAAPVLGGSPFNAAGVAGAPGTPAGPALPAPQPLGPDLGNGFPAVADASDHLATSNDSLKGSVDKLTAATDKAAAAKSPSASTGGGDQSGLGSLLGLLALGGAAAALFGRRTTGSAASSSPGTVFSSGGMTTQTSGSVHPALVQTNPQPSAALGIAGAAIAGIGCARRARQTPRAGDRRRPQRARRFPDPRHRPAARRRPIRCNPRHRRRRHR